MRAWRLPLLAAFLLIVTAACGRNKPVPTPAPAAPTPPAAPAPATAQAPAPVDNRPVIVAFGDSLTEGLRVPPAENYPSRLQRLLDERGYRYRVENAGISGNTSQDGLNRVDAMLARMRPAIVIVELGANDALRGLPVPQMKQNLAQIVERIQRAGARVVLAGMEAPPNLGPQYTAQFRQVFPDLAQQYRTALIPFFLAGVGGRPDLNQADGIHPTGAGYAIITQNVFQVLEPLLKS